MATAPSVNTDRAENAVLVRTAQTATHRWQWLLVSGITLLAAALRLVDLGKTGFRIDEGFTMTFARQSWRGVIGLDGYYDLHPPLFFTLAKLANLFLPETVASRSVAAIAGIATIPVFYAFCRRLADYRVALGAALLVSISPLHIEFSRDGRMYAPVLFFVTVGWLALISFIQTRGRGWAALYGFSLLLAFYTDYSAVYAVAPQLLVVGAYLFYLRREAAWLAGAVIGAAIGYLPWLPEVYRSVDRSSEHAGRADWLSASWSRIGNSVPSLLGFHGRTVTGGGDTADTWARWPWLHWPLLLLVVPVLIAGFVALRRYRESRAIVIAMILTPPLAAIILSQISPGYAPRTIMASVLGIAILVSAFLLGGPPPAAVRAVGAAGWIYLAVVSIISLPATYEVGTRSEWPAIANDLAEQRALDKPIVIFSTAGTLTDMIDLYAGDQLEPTEFITLLDGEREEMIGYERWLDRGPTLAAIENGALEALLPAGDPGKDALWVILRFGGWQVPGYLHDLGYEEIGSFRYIDTIVSLYARRGATLGQEIPVDNAFTPSSDPAHGWELKESRIEIRPTDGTDPNAREIVMVQDRGAATFRFSPGGGGLVTVDIAIRGGGDQDRVILRCKASSGEDLFADRYRVGPQAQSDEWRTFRFAERCPAGTTLVTVMLERYGSAEIAFRDIRVQYSPDQPIDP